MNAPTHRQILFHPRRYRHDLAARLRRATRGEVLFDDASRARYATDASIYQIEPVGVFVPRDEDDVRAAVALCRELGVPILPRGAGSSQCGQSVGRALVIDTTKHLDAIVAFDAGARTVEVQPGLVLDRLNAFLKPHGLWFPVDVSTSAQATLGGMAGNNSCGARSLAYGNMVHNVSGIDALLADGTEEFFGPFGVGAARPMGSARTASLVARLFEIGAREHGEIAARWPRLLRRVGGYNLDVFHPQSPRPYTADGSVNLAHLLVGSEGTLAHFRRLHLALAPLPAHKVLGAVSFARFHRAMECTAAIVDLMPTAVELVDRTMIDLARENPAFRPVIEAALVGQPEALLLVEFAGEERGPLLARLADLDGLMAALGAPGSVVALTEERAQQALWEVRKAGLNILMSMKGDGKPVSFIEDCAVPLEHLAEYTARLSEIFARHGTRGTWYAHASVGTLHVRPVLDLRRGGAGKMRAIAEEASALVRAFKGAYSGEHGDGLVRSEWVAWQFGPRLTRAFEEIKTLFDPDGLMNPGKIVRPPPMDDATLLRTPPGHANLPLRPALDWSAWNVRSDAATGLVGAPGSGGDPAGGFAMAAEMCNSNGHCRKFDAGTMCPSYRVTKNERDLTRGRANTLRLALAGRFGAEGIASDAVADALDLCVSCKGCRRECPTGVDMARMKIEARHLRHATHRRTWRERLFAYLPRYAHWGARLPWLLRARDVVPGLARFAEKRLGLAAARPLPRWRRDPFLRERRPVHGPDAAEVVLFVDTFTNAFEPENARAALRVLAAAGRKVDVARAAGAGRPLCCGRSFLSAGLVEEAKVELERLLRTLTPYAARGIPIVGLEPACLLTLRDEARVMGLGEDAEIVARQAVLLEEWLAREMEGGRIALPLGPLPYAKALLHGHCHQKAFDAMPAVERVLRAIPGLEVQTIVSSCCGMAGSFGYEAEHYAVSMQMAEAALLPAVRAAGRDTVLVADGTSCRQQIAHGAAREAVHVVRLLAQSLEAGPAHPT